MRVITRTDCMPIVWPPIRCTERPGCDLLVAVVEHHALAVDRAHHADDVLDLEGVAEGVLADVPAGGELHLLVLQMEARLGEVVPVADVVVVQVGDDDVLDLLGVDAEIARAGRPDCA